MSARRATMLPRFARDGQHRRTQCCRHNVSSFCQGLILYLNCVSKLQGRDREQTGNSRQALNRYVVISWRDIINNHRATTVRKAVHLFRPDSGLIATNMLTLIIHRRYVIKVKRISSKVEAHESNQFFESQRIMKRYMIPQVGINVFHGQINVIDGVLHVTKFLQQRKRVVQVVERGDWLREALRDAVTVRDDFLELNLKKKPKRNMKIDGALIHAT